MDAHEIYEQDNAEARDERLFPPAAPRATDDLTIADGVLPPAPTATLRGTLPGGGTWTELDDA